MRRLILLLFILCFICVLVIGYRYVQQNKSATPAQFTDKRIQEDSELKQRVNLALEGRGESGVSVQLRKQDHNADNTSTLFVELSAPEYTAFDAIDLQISFANNTSVPDCTTGDAVPLYPRFEVNKGGVSLTGIADIENKHILFGNGNSTVLTCIFSAESRSNKITAEVVTANTHIYSLGVDIIDLSSSTTQLSW